MCCLLNNCVKCMFFHLTIITCHGARPDFLFSTVQTNDECDTKKLTPKEDAAVANAVDNAMTDLAAEQLPTDNVEAKMRIRSVSCCVGVSSIPDGLGREDCRR